MPTPGVPSPSPPPYTVEWESYYIRYYISAPENFFNFCIGGNTSSRVRQITGKLMR